MPDAMPTSPTPLQSATYSILIADRKLPTRIGNHALLTDQPGLYLLPPVSTGAELLKGMDRYRPDALLMGAWFQDGDGIALCRILLSRYSDLRVIFVANEANAPLVLHAVQAGASGFILKTIHPARLFAIVAQVLDGQPAFDHDLVSTAMRWMGRRSDSPAGMNPHLSPRHQQILPLLSGGLTNKEIGRQLNLSEKTVKNYLADLFDRLHMTRRPRVAAWFIGQTSREPSSFNTTWPAPGL